MRLLGSRYLTAALLAIAAVLSLGMLWLEFSAQAQWAICAELMRHTLALCDAGPGDWVVGLTALLAALLSAASGAAFERARRSHDIG